MALSAVGIVGLGQIGRYEDLNGDGWESRCFKATISQASSFGMMGRRIEANNRDIEGFVTLRC